MSAITIDPELRDWLPGLSTEELENLKADIKRNGCRDPLVVWKEHNTLLDGHNRYRICTELNVPYETVEMSFPGKDGAKLWMARNQLARRNLTDFQRGEMALNLKPLFEMKAKERQSAAGGSRVDKPVKPLVEKLPQAQEQRTRDEVGKIAGVSGKTIDKVAQILKSGNREIIEQARAAKISINKAHQAVKKTGPKERPAKAISSKEASIKGWDSLKGSTLGRIRDYCRRNASVCLLVLNDMKDTIVHVMRYMEKHNEALEALKKSAKTVDKPKTVPKTSPTKLTSSTETSKPKVEPSTMPTEVSASKPVPAGSKPTAEPGLPATTAAPLKDSPVTSSSTFTTPPAKGTTTPLSQSSPASAAKAPPVANQTVASKSHS